MYFFCPEMRRLLSLPRCPAAPLVLPSFEILHRDPSDDSPDDDIGGQRRDRRVEPGGGVGWNSEGDVCSHQDRRREGDAAPQTTCTRFPLSPALGAKLSPRQ